MHTTREAHHRTPRNPGDGLRSQAEAQTQTQPSHGRQPQGYGGPSKVDGGELAFDLLPQAGRQCSSVTGSKFIEALPPVASQG